MPFRDIKQFDAETLRSMTQAFDAACDRLGLGADDPERGELAAAIIELASMGERDAAKLFSLAVEALDVSGG
jgi:hypothetical protein